MSAFQAFFIPDSAQEPDCGPHDDDQHSEGAHNAMSKSSLNADTIAPVQPGHNIAPSEILARLHALPFRMAETFGKPENGHDVLATLSAIATLTECCNASFASHDIGGSYQAMVTWLSKNKNHGPARNSPAWLKPIPLASPTPVGATVSFIKVRAITQELKA
ncbi:C6 transcription factor [Purpureocillium lavendulum]|uniref:C6 transcription factor n=1 Tax=Purpureocillium lavendulum TaxID=1247861 RepID=A0AB34FII6_9HYPO|nr:C6 transcription factor [Purpureocillium lavendulum]